MPPRSGFARLVGRVHPQEAGLPPARWGVTEAFAGTLVAFVAAGVIGAAILAAGSSCGSPAMVAGEAVGELGIGAVILVWLRFVSKAPFAALGRPSRPVGDVVTGVLGGLALIVIASVVAAIVIQLVTVVIGHQPHEPSQIPSCVRGTWLALLGPVVILAAPVGEEMAFRGFLYRGLRARFSVWPAALMSGALFGLIHILPLIVPALFVVGIGLALIYEWRQSLLASIAAHATFNLIGFLAIFHGR
ncbi:MAG TPA: CPBP family intramembrane glutamic endopeptidase [Actinomycetota bacterium]|nr:CPBP family intramembrane glutamic endopeptidase [Actinomycetota bacterium]